MKKFLILVLVLMLAIMSIALMSCEKDGDDDDDSSSCSYWDDYYDGYYDDYYDDDYYDDYESSSNYQDDASSSNESSSSSVAITNVTLNETLLYLNVGDYVTLYATVSPSNASLDDLTWNSYGDAIEMDLDGQGYAVLAVEPGTAYINVMAPSGMCAQCTVIVEEEGTGDNTGNKPDDSTDTQEVLASSISLNLTSTTLKKGEFVNLIATILPSNTTNKEITWTSSNTAVAIVADGTVATIGKGTTIITANTSNVKTATCVVTV